MILLQCWQWPVGSFLITATWLNLLTYFQHVPYFGIYILMFKDILTTASKFGLILLIFLIAFGLGFHLLFIKQVPRVLGPRPVKLRHKHECETVRGTNEIDFNETLALSACI